VGFADPPSSDPEAHRVADLGPFKVLDVAATRDPDARRQVLAVVNRAPQAAVRATVTIGGAAAGGRVTTWRVEAQSPDTRNDFDRPDEVTVREERRALEAGRLEEAFPPHSLTVLELELGWRARWAPHARSRLAGP
jgi:alpha-L-arabinofuranosidase